MAEDKLTFSCPFCGTRLNVPASLSGVEGPCPSCRARIRAPEWNPTPEVAATSSPSLDLVLSPPPAEAVAALTEATPPFQETLVDAGYDDGSNSSRIRPEPRQLPERDQSQIIQPKHSTEDERLRRRSLPASQSERRRTLLWLVIPALVVAAFVGVVVAVIFFFGPNSARQKHQAATRPLAVPPPHRIATSPAPPQPPPAGTAISTEPGETLNSELIPPPVEPVPTLIPEPAAPQTSPISPLTPPEPPVKIESASLVSARLLEKFLVSPNAAGWSQKMEPSVSEDELNQHLFLGPLPELLSLQPDEIRTYDAEKITDFHFIASFRGPHQSPPVSYTLAVRKRADAEPKILAQPVLDLLGRRLKDFSAQPNQETRTFFAIIEPSSGCYDSNVPNPERKFTLKLKTTSVGKEVGRAYINNASKLHSLLTNYESGLGWGSRSPAAINLQWNVTEDPAKPYLEVADIKALHWNP